MSVSVLQDTNNLNCFSNKNVTYTISSRMFTKDMNIQDYLNKYYPYISISQLESLFGFVPEFTPLYGGRMIDKCQSLTNLHVEEMYENNIGVSLTLTNHYFDEEDYQKSYSLLEKYHKEGNSIVCVNDELAIRLKKDFPLYKTKASLIKDINTYNKVVESLKIYDLVVIPMEMNDDIEFLKSLPSKERIILFANANCAYNCKSRICYSAVSKQLTNKSKPKFTCSKGLVSREQLGHTYFDVDKLYELGFLHFKLVPDPKVRKVEKELANNEQIFLQIISKYKPIYYMFSFPKSGRTWLRFALANYINIQYNLGLRIDLHSMFTLIPNDGANLEKGIGAYSYVKDQRFPAVISSHKSLDKIEENNGIIILLRLVFDVMVSDYHQHVYFLKIFNGSIKEFIRKDNSSLHTYCKFVNSINSLNSKNIILTYEMMHDDMNIVMTKTLDFLNISINQDILSKAIIASSFENMKNNEDKYGIAGKNDSGGNPNGLRVREGKVGNYFKYLDEDDVIYIQEFCDKNLSLKSKEILSSFNINYKGKLCQQ